MDTLPVEILAMIIQQLTPQDLARCSAVSHGWREMFNQDWMWKPHCDPELEEPLRTIPCLVTPAFQPPETANLDPETETLNQETENLDPETRNLNPETANLDPETETLNQEIENLDPETRNLSPICRWKLAFMRENHLWGNWRRYRIEDKKEIMFEFRHDVCIQIEFLTDTLILVVYSKYIEILDVSTTPANLVARSMEDDSVHISPFTTIIVRGLTKMASNVEADGSTLNAKLYLVNRYKDFSSVYVYSVDIKNQTICKDKIEFGNVITHAFKDDVHICLTYDSSLILFDLQTGKMIKKEPLPVEDIQNQCIKFDISTSQHSDFVALHVTFRSLTQGVDSDSDSDFDSDPDYSKYYFYSLKQRAFLPNPVAFTEFCPEIALTGPYFAVIDWGMLKIYNCLTQELLITRLTVFRNYYSMMGLGVLYGLPDAFVFLDCDNEGRFLRIYFPSTRNLTKICEFPGDGTFLVKTTHHKFIAVISIPSTPSSLVGLWIILGQKVKKTDISADFLGKYLTDDYGINRSFSKVINRADREILTPSLPELSRKYGYRTQEFWYIINFW